MTPAEREALVERMAEAIHNTNPGAYLPWSDIVRAEADGDRLAKLVAASRRGEARAALTLAEPVVREACAIIAERASTCRVKTETGWKTKPDAVAERCAAAIRAGKVTL